ncbi:hypothetical protein [Bradyrhizobium zhanjiangense]|uniref:Uncharacterized protein n=1 Tax=Bradyrhizobium zhanjiangense TaxID=1325107 RepID=A0A4Q0Q964_9BRAD|nr:hypothetical protein [Bradyrhizobium zhanjiangense]RXG86146.1 hypothetical protein EAS61_34045 [Bradyrhizobium zhanjiangense]
MQQHETIVTSLAKRGEQLAAKRAAAQDTLDRAITGRQQTLLSGDLGDQRALDKLQANVDAAASALAGIDDALVILAHQKTEAERQLGAERERIERASAADKLHKQVVAIEAALPGYLAQSKALADALSDVSHFHFESGQMAGFLQNTGSQIEIAANFTLAELKAMPDAIRQGRQPIPREVATAPVPLPEPASPTMTAFMLRSARYCDPDGRRRFAGQWEDATMPVATAQRALGKGIAAPLTDPRRAQLRGARGGDFDPKAPDVVDLDAVAEPPTAPKIEPDTVLREANFTVIDRSAEARTIEIEVPRT